MATSDVSKITREEFINLTHSESTKELVQAVGRHVAHGDPFDLKELIETCSQGQVEEIWNNLLMKTTSALQQMACQAADDNQEKEDGSHVLDAVVTIAMATIKRDPVIVPDALYQVAVMLHGVLLSIPEEDSKLSGNIGKLLECWWLEELGGREALMPQTLMYLINLALSSGMVSNVKRVWAIREAFTHVNYDDETSDSLKTLLKQCTTSAFLKFEEGRKFLSFILTLDTSLIDLLHTAVKSQLPTFPKFLTKHIGEVYFRAWTVATGPVLQKLEVSCIQDLMFCAIHGRRRGNRGLAPVLLQVLSYFHENKKQKGVDEMLLRLYGPILWRSFKVANGEVRANAAAILVSVFPLQDSSASKKDSDELNQKQFDILQDLLEDPCPVVRTIAIKGVCRLLCNCWELIPGPVIKAFLVKLVEDLAWDASAVEVRCAVIKGLGILTEGHMSHRALKTILPDLKNMLHDTSQLVQICFLDLLLKVKSLKSIRFWNIVTMEHLLVQLEQGSEPVARRIVELIFRSYMPLDRPLEVQLFRCIRLVQQNPGAARRFYRHAAAHMNVSQICQFISLLCHCILECVKKETDGGNVSNTSQGSQDKENENPEVDTGEVELTIQDTTLMSGLLETITILWQASSQELQKPGNSEELKKLMNRFGAALPKFFKAFDDPRISHCLVLLAGYLPANMIPTFSCSAVSKLRAMTDKNMQTDYSMLLDTLCRWSKAGGATELISDWLTQAFDAASLDDSSESKKSRPSDGKRVQFSDPSTPQPMLGLKFLQYMTQTPVCQTHLLTERREDLTEIRDQLKQVMNAVKKRMTLPGPIDPTVSDDFLVLAFETLCKLEILLYDEESNNNTLVETYKQILTWMNVELVSLVSSVGNETLALKANKKRKLYSFVSPVGADHSLPGDTSTLNSTILTGGISQVKEFATPFVQMLLNVCCNMLLIGITDKELLEQISDFATSLLSSEHYCYLLPDTARLLYQLVEVAHCYRTLEGDQQYSGEHVNELVSKLVRMLALMVKNKKDDYEKILQKVKSPLMEICSYYNHQEALADPETRDVIITVLGAAVADMTNAVQNNELDQPVTISEFPALSSYILGIISKKHIVCRIFAEELHQCISSGAVETLEGHLAIAHIIRGFSKLKAKPAALKECINALTLQSEQSQDEGSVTEEESVIKRDLQDSIKNVLKDCMTEVGMVA